MYVLGLYSDGEYFKVALIHRRGKTSRIEFIKEFKKNISSLNKLKKILDSKMGILGEKVEVVSALSPEDVFVKKFVFPLLSKRKVKKALAYELSSEPMYHEEERVFVPIFKKKKDETEVTLYGYTKDAMGCHLQNIKTLGIESDWTSVVSRGIERFSEFFTNEEGPYLIFHLGWESSLFYSMKNNEIEKEASFKLGMKNIVDAMAKDQLISGPLDMDGVQNLFLETIETNDNSACTDVFIELERHLSRIWAFMVVKDNKEMFFSKILFTGYAEFSRELKELLPPINLEEVKVIPHIEYNSRNLTNYAIELGLALDRVISGSQTLQLGEGQFIPFGQKRKARRYIYRYAALSLLSAVVVFSTIDAYFIKKRCFFKKRYTELVAEVNAFGIGEKVEASFQAKALRENRIKCMKKVKEQKKIDRSKRGPFLLTSVANLLKSVGVDGKNLLDMEYRVTQGSDRKNMMQEFVVEVSLNLAKMDTKLKRDAFLKKLEKASKDISFELEPVVRKSGGETRVIMRIKG